MPVSFKTPASPKRSVLTVNEFLGVDFTNSPTTVDIKKSPNAVNMIRDVPGKVRKSMGWRTVSEYKDENGNPLKINGCHCVRGDDDEYFIHAGEYLFHDTELIYSGMNDVRSRSWQFKDKLYIADGKKLIQISLTYSGTEAVKKSSSVKVPLAAHMPFKDNLLEFKYYAGLSQTVDKQPSLKDQHSTFRDFVGDIGVIITDGDGNTNEYKSVLQGTGYYIHGGPYIPPTNPFGQNYTSGVSTFASLEPVDLEPAPFDYDTPHLYSMSVNPLWANRVNGSVSILSDEMNLLNKTVTYCIGHFYTNTSSGWTKATVSGKTMYKYTLSEANPNPHENIKAAIWCSAAVTYAYRDLTKNDGIAGDRIAMLEKTLYFYPVQTKSFPKDIDFELRYMREEPDVRNIEEEGYFADIYKMIEAITFPAPPFTVEAVEESLTDCKGEIYLRYNSENVIDTITTETVNESAYIPTLTISKDPNGGGTQYEDLNLLQPAFTETFLGQENVKEYCMSFGGLDDTPVKVEIMNAEGDFEEKTEGTDFTVDRETGIITFVTAPGKSPMTGEDNVKITAYRTVEGYADRINHCRIGTLYGVNGALDRLFLSGNPEYRNYDWFSAQYDPTYFADTSYSILGSDQSAIIGYSIISNYLATHKDSHEKDQNIILRQGDLEENVPSFRIVNTLQGAGAVAKDSFAYLSTEPLFLTESGIYAVTAQDITGEKYAQNRSFFLNGKLLEEKNLSGAFGFVYKDMYWLCLNNVAYILDGLQPVQTDKSSPYSTRQYVGFYRTNMPVNTMWEQDGHLWFGTQDGKICRFAKDKYDPNSYNDDGQPIEAIWETPDIDGDLFYKNKTARYLALRLDSAITTSVSIWGMKRGIWNFIKKDEASASYLSFPNIDFSKFSFRTDTTATVIPVKVRLKKVDKFRLRLTNDGLNEPFGLFDLAVEFVENGNYKG